MDTCVTPSHTGPFHPLCFSLLIQIYSVPIGLSVSPGTKITLARLLKPNGKASF